MRRIALGVMGAMLLVVPAAAHAAAWGVSNTTDTPIGQACPGFTGCSLREAVTSTELNPGPDAILVGTGTYPLTNGELTVTQSLTVARVGAGGATISGAGASRIFALSGSGTAFILRFLTVTDGDVSGVGPSHGGAILGGPGTSIGIESSTISNSSVSADSDAQGGAIFSQGPVTIGTASGSTTGSSITGNSATANTSPGVARGGGVAVQGASLSVGARTSISGNTADAGSGATDSATGGGAYADSGVTVNGVTVSGNGASGGTGNGGGVDIAGGTGTFMRSTISGNTATTTADSVGGGGGVAVESSGAGSVGLQFSTVSGNTATTTSTPGAVAAGGAIASFAATGTLDASNSTIASNAVSAPAGSAASGAGIFAVGNTATVGATILAENTGSAGSQCEGAVLSSGGYDVFGPLGTCPYSAGTGDVTGVSDAMLKSLANYGGLTETRMVKLASPALDIIPAADPLCAAAGVDQRGITRPQNGNCDSGSVEARPATLALTPASQTFTTVPVSQTSTASETVSNGGDLDMSAAPNASVAAPFSYTSGCTSPVAGGGSCTMVLTFAPTAGGSVSDTLQVTSGPLSDTSTLTGIGWAPTRALVIKGSPSVGFKSGLWHGEWPGVLASVTAQWIRCDADGTSNCIDIAGATSTTYRASGDDAGHTLRVRATGTSSGGVTSDPVTTDASPVVTVLIPTAYKAPQIDRAANPVTLVKLGVYGGQWTGAPILKYDIQWTRCDHAGANCTDIAGATHSTYVPHTADVDHTLVVRIVATNSVGSSAPVLTAPSGVMVLGWAPTRALVIKGSPSVGFKSGLWHGEWPGVLASVTAQWIRCDADGTSNCTDIAGATSTVYRSSADDAGHTLRVRATGTSSGGVTSDPVTTDPSPVVTVLIPTAYKAPQIDRAASPVTGIKLGVYGGQWTGAPILNYDIQWTRCDHAGANCTDIAGATHSTYVPHTADVDHTLVVRIVATNSVGSSAPVLTAPSGVVSLSV